MSEYRVHSIAAMQAVSAVGLVGEVSIKFDYITPLLLLIF